MMDKSLQELIKKINELTEKKKGSNEVQQSGQSK